MTKISKNLRAADQKISRLQTYDPESAVKLMIATAATKFDATAEIHFHLGIEPKHADQQIRSTFSLPHGIGKKIRVVAICEDDQSAAAKKAGAVQVGAEELIEKIVKGWTDFDALVATPSQMKNLAKAARVLGPRGLMPSPKTGTVAPELSKIISELAAGRIELRNDKYGNVHTIFGKVSFGEQKLAENLAALIGAIKDARPAAAKGEFFKNITINSTMNRGIKVEVSGRV